MVPHVPGTTGPHQDAPTPRTQAQAELRALPFCCQHSSESRSALCSWRAAGSGHGQSTGEAGRLHRDFQNSLERELSFPGALWWDLSPPWFVHSPLALGVFVSAPFAGLFLAAPLPPFSSFAAFQQLGEGWMEQFSSWPWISLSPRKQTCAKLHFAAAHGGKLDQME